ncbi:ABC transporter ATP-binding protein [Brevibacillus borstelensis]|uniref:ABC transporter ATP-binding protein n=1 Tax=Brevibacillus borstelensis TaxID=45462 RepID=UPI0030C55DC0
MMKSPIVQATAYVWRIGKSWVIISLLGKIISGCIPFMILTLTKELIDEVAKLFQNQNHAFDRLLLLLLLQLIVSIVQSVLPKVQEYLDEQMGMRLGRRLQQKVFQKTTSVPLIYYEAPEFYNQIDRVSASGSHFLSPLQSFLSMIESIISLSSYIVFLTSVHWSLVVLVFAAVIPMFLTEMVFGKKRYQLHVDLTPLKRTVSYFAHLLKDKQTAQEIRLFGLSDYLLNKWSEYNREDQRKTLELQLKQHSSKVAIDGLSAIFYMCAIGIMLWLSRTIKLTMGDFVSMGQAIQGTQTTLYRLASSIAKIFEDKRYIAEYYQFQDFRLSAFPHPSGSKPFPPAIKQGIEFSQVRFQYINSERAALHDVSFYIKPKEKISIVGANGSGKTTLVKCLLGLYPVTSGRITIDGIPITDIEEKSLWKNVTAIFQDFVRYHFTVRENIAISNLAGIERIESVKRAGALSGAEPFVNKLPNGYETILGKWLTNGEELSGGQWQKIAIARALFKESQIVILDEPTAALDPLAEVEVFEKFKLLAEDKIAIFISHRMASAKLADRIIVMKDGKVVEMGTHEECMARRQEYYRMYQAQSQWFATEAHEQEELFQWKS